ncbi:hypothetical protein GIB67_021787 [Kingdonia uniflora]|uniref:Uncharacterized protein n=1 Tax=Kingdonia uniflora TaxID=39325 RepID=A0A7J7M9N2_9MAGN|nr:hypothetical protein GIB67_021787 [Kingdonia uniflora]
MVRLISMDYVLSSMVLTYLVMVQQDGYIDSLFILILAMIKHRTKEYEYAKFQDKEKVITLTKLHNLH